MSRTNENIHYVTIFTDASFKDKQGGWGCWVKSNHGGFTTGGPFLQIENINHAELMAASNALGEAALRGILDPVPGHRTFIVFCIDNKHVIGLLNGRHSNCKVEREVMQKLNRLGSLYNFTWRAKHVKAHSGTKTPRTWVNDLCDKISKEQRKAIMQ